MRADILQPNYLPWVGCFDQIYRSDIFVFYDDVQYDKHGWRNRNKIRCKDGWQWLTVPVLTKGYFGELISEKKINNDVDWRRKHWGAIRQNYAKAPYFQEYSPFFEEVYSRGWIRLVDLNIAIIKMVSSLLGIKANFIRSSELGVSGKGTERLIKICQKIKADSLLEGAVGEDYIEEDKFKKAGIKLIYHNYKHPVYSQQFKPFIPYMSVIDLLFNCGEESLSILRGKREED